MPTVEDSTTSISDNTSRIINELTNYAMLVAFTKYGARGEKTRRKMEKRKKRSWETLRKVTGVRPRLGIGRHEIQNYSFGIYRSRAQSSAQCRRFNASHFLISDHCGIFLSTTRSRWTVTWNTVDYCFASVQYLNNQIGWFRQIAITYRSILAYRLHLHPWSELSVRVQPPYQQSAEEYMRPPWKSYLLIWVKWRLRKRNNELTFRKMSWTRRLTWI